MLNSHAVRAIKNRRAIITQDGDYTGNSVGQVRSKIDTFRSQQNTHDAKNLADLPDVKYKGYLISLNAYGEYFVSRNNHGNWQPIPNAKFGNENNAKSYIDTLPKVTTDRKSNLHPRWRKSGYKVTDQIIKGFMIYKSGKNPNTYYAKNENGEEYEGTMEEIKKKIDAYWMKRDEDVMKQKVRDGKTYNFIQLEKMIGEKAALKLLAIANEARYASSLGSKYPFEKVFKAKATNAGFLGPEINFYLQHFKDSKTKDKSPRWRIKDDKMFKLKTAAKKMKDSKAKDAASPVLFDNDFEGWKRKAESLGYEVKENKTTGLWEAKEGIGIKGTYNKTKGGRLYLDSKAKDVSAKEIRRQIDELKRRANDKTLSKQQREYYKEKLQTAESLFAAYNPVWKSKGQYDSKTKDGGPGSGRKGHTTPKKEEPSKGRENKRVDGKKSSQEHVGKEIKVAKHLLGAGVKQGEKGFTWNKTGGYANAKINLVRIKLAQAGFKKVDSSFGNHPDGSWTHKGIIYQNENGDTVKISEHYGVTARQNRFSIAYEPKEFNKDTYTKGGDSIGAFSKGELETTDDLFYKGVYYKPQELHALLVKEGMTKKLNELTESEKRDRKGNAWPLYESNGGVFAVVN